MATEVKVPATGNAGEDAVVLEWHYSVGEHVEAGASLVSLETAKAVVEVDAPVAGTLLAVNGAEGDELGEHQVIALIGEPGESAPAAERPTRPTRPTDADGRRVFPPGRSRFRASPRARRLAAEREVDLAEIEGSGPLGRIVTADVPETAEKRADADGAAGRGASDAVVEDRAPRVVPVRGARKVTAERMHASAQTAAPVTITRYAPAEALQSYSRRLRETTDRRGSQRIGINELLLFAVARTVGRHPAANAWFSGATMSQYEAVHLGFAVDTGGALLVPVIRDADRLGLAELADRARSSIERAREGGLGHAEMDGGTFTVSNLGSLGVHWFTPILNPPQVCILGVGAIHQAGGPDAQLPLSLTFDHRALDGAAAATLLADICEAIEHIDTLTAF